MISISKRLLIIFLLVFLLATAGLLIYKYKPIKETTHESLVLSNNSKITPTTITTNTFVPTQAQKDGFEPFTLPIYTYHNIKIHAPNDNMSVSPTAFENQLKQIIDGGFSPVTFGDVLSHIENGEELPRKPIILLFNNGMDNQYTTAFPLLKKYNLKASFGITTSFIDQSGYMTWEQIKEMKTAGNEMVSHTVTHPDLSKLNRSQLEAELGNAKKTLDEKLSQNTQTLIYTTDILNPLIETITKEQGYKLAKSTKIGTEVNKDNLLELFGIPALESTQIK